MIVREAKQEDIDSIIILLQASLGESLLKKSAEISIPIDDPIVDCIS